MLPSSPSVFGGPRGDAGNGCIFVTTRLSTYLTEFPEVVSHPHAPSKDLVVALMLHGITKSTANAWSKSTHMGTKWGNVRLQICDFFDPYPYPCALSCALGLYHPLPLSFLPLNCKRPGLAPARLGSCRKVFGGAVALQHLLRNLIWKAILPNLSSSSFIDRSTEL